MRVFICRNLKCSTMEFIHAVNEWCPGCGEIGQYSQTLENGKTEFLETMDLLHAALAEAQMVENELAERMRCPGCVHRYDEGIPCEWEQRPRLDSASIAAGTLEERWICHQLGMGSQWRVTE